MSAPLADSVSALFLRAAVDAGVTTWGLPGISEFVDTGDQLLLDLRTGEAKNVTKGAEKQFPPVSDVIPQFLDAGGSHNWALRTVHAEHALR